MPAQARRVAAIGLRVVCLTAMVLGLLCFWTGSQDQFELPKLTGMALCAGAGTLFLIPRGIRGGLSPIPLVFLLLLVPSLIFSESFWTSFWGDYENFAGYWTWTLLAVLSLLGSVAFTKKSPRRFLVFFVAATGLAGAYSLVQGLGWDPVAWDPASMMGPRFFGSLGNPNFLAAAAAMALAPVLALALELGSLKDFPRLRYLAIATAMVLVLTLRGSGSRGGLIGAGLGLIVFLLVHLSGPPSQPARHNSLFFWNLAIILIMAALLFSNSPLRQRMAESLAHPRAEISRGRLHIWAPALAMAIEHPLAGVGLDCFKIAFPRYQGADFARIDGDIVSSRNAHNEILQFLSTAGIPGLIACLFLAVWAVRAFRTVLLKAAENKKTLWAGAAGLLAAYAGQGLFSFGVAGTLVPVFLLLGLLNSDKPSKGRRWIWGLPLIGIFLAFTWTQRLLADCLFSKGMAAQALLDQAPNPGEGPPQPGPALARMDSTVRLFPHEAKYRVYRGLAYEKSLNLLPAGLASGALDEAEAEYREALRLVPLNPYYWNNLGRILEIRAEVSGADLGGAGKAYEKSAQLAPEAAFFWANLALFQEGRGLRQDSASSFRRCLGLSPDLGRRALERAASLASSSGDGARARELLGLIGSAPPVSSR